MTILTWFIGRKLGWDERFLHATALWATAILCSMSNRMKIALVAVAAAAAVIATAVGLAVAKDDPPTQAEYQTAVVSARNRTDAALAWVTKSQSAEELIARLEDAAIVVDRAADDLDEADTLDRFEETNEQLIKALRALSTDLEGTAAQMQQPGFTDLLQGTRGLSFDSWTRINARIDELQQDGIAVKPLERH